MKISIMHETDIISEIRIAFSKTRLPEKDSLLSMESAGIYEAIELREAFSSSMWNQLKLPLLLRHKSALNYFSNEAFVYFLPTYMKCIILDIEKSDTLVEILINKLLLPTEHDFKKEYSSIQEIEDIERSLDLSTFYEHKIENIEDEIHFFIKRTAFLSDRQSKCVLMFLLYLKENFSNFIDEKILQSAVRRYWFKFQS